MSENEVPVEPKKGPSELELQSVKKALQEAGVEIYRTLQNEIHVAERIRFHMMDSGVRVLIAGGPKIYFTARAQRSDFPEEGSNELFERLRSRIGVEANARGYRESHSATVEVKDPLDERKVLDVWHEVRYERALESLDALVGEVQWALSAERFLATTPEGASP